MYQIIVSIFLYQYSFCDRMGNSLALGALPCFMLKGCLHLVLDGLILSLKPQSKAEEKMAEARRDAVKAISR